MIIDERTYSIVPAQVGAYLDLYVAEGMAIQTGHLGNLIGWFTQDIGTVNDVVHLWQYDGLADRDRRRAALEADPAWQAFRAKAAPLVQTMKSRILKPTWFSPLGGSGVRP